MQFAVAAILKPGTEQELIKHSAEFNEQIGPNGEDVRLPGALLDEAGRKVGYLAILDGDTIGQVRDWVDESPIYRAGLYDRLDVFQYQVEVGRLT
jgi:hypothetical protein